MPGNSASSLASTYQTLQEWIRQQQEYEATQSAPAPLTNEQRKALQDLELAVTPTSAPHPEPELGAENWVGLLTEYHQRLRGGVAGVQFTEGIDDPVSGKWRCHVSTNENQSPFPGAAGGLYPDGTQPSFAKKKDAKQYAAKCAVDWLRTNGRMPKNGGVKFPKAQQQPASQQPQSLNNNSNKCRHSSSTNDGATSGVAPLSSASPFDDSKPSAATEVDILCQELGWHHVQYHLKQDDKDTGFWSGSPDLGINRSLFPEDCGRVSNVMGKKAAKEKIAEDLVVHMRKILADRLELSRQLG